MPAPTLLCRRSAWTSTLTAGLELAKPGEVALTQEGVFSTLLRQPSPHDAGRLTNDVLSSQLVSLR